MAAQIDAKGDGSYVLSGELGFDTVAKLYPGPLNGQSDVRLDLGDIDRADSAGLALLLQWAQDVRQRGGEIQFDNIPEQLAAMIKVAELESVFGL